ncbi:MAG: hypothetical protein KDD82_03850 [Planctomycetes bacterium]|nr:hypothetical protein [Planctomycetota bacterium]
MLGVWVKYFALTLAIELPIAAALAPASDRGRAVLAAALASLTTHPLLTAALFTYAPPLGVVVLLEVAIALLEGAALRFAVPLTWGRALTVSGVMNAASALSSPLWWWVFG